MANVIFGEKVAAAQWMAAFIGLAGTWLVIRPPFPGTGGWLLLLPLGMGFRFALYNVLTREMHGTHQRESLSHGALGVHRVELCHALGLAYPFPESGVGHDRNRRLGLRPSPFPRQCFGLGAGITRGAVHLYPVHLGRCT